MTPGRGSAPRRLRPRELCLDQSRVLSAASASGGSSPVRRSLAEPPVERRRGVAGARCAARPLRLFLRDGLGSVAGPRHEP